MKLFLLFIALSFGFSQSPWITSEDGLVEFKSQYQSEWTPIVKREKLALNNFIRSSANSRLRIISDSLKLTLTDSNVLFLNDLFIKNIAEFQIELTRLEAMQLNRAPRESKPKEKTFGVTYGKSSLNTIEISETSIGARMNTVNQLIALDQRFAAILSIKRMMINYTELTHHPILLNQYFLLLEAIALPERIHSEIATLKRDKIENAELNTLILNWEAKKQ